MQGFISLKRFLQNVKHNLLLTRKEARQIFGTLKAHFSTKRRRIDAQIRSKMIISSLPTRKPAQGSVWAVSMMRNEHSLLPTFLHHCELQGIDGAVIADNLSTDDTLSILRSYVGPLNLIVVEDHEELYYQQHKMDILAGIARTQGAEWIVPMDADEFWYGATDKLGETLRKTPQNIKIQSAKVHNVVQGNDGYRMGSNSDRLPKVAYRWHKFAHLHIGNHGVDRPGMTGHDLRVLHFSYRSERQFIDKIRKGAQALRYVDHDPRHPGHSWLDLNEMNDSQLRETYFDMLQGEGPDFMDWIPRGKMLHITPFPWDNWKWH